MNLNLYHRLADMASYIRTLIKIVFKRDASCMKLGRYFSTKFIKVLEYLHELISKNTSSKSITAKFLPNHRRQAVHFPVQKTQNRYSKGMPVFLKTIKSSLFMSRRRADGLYPLFTYQKLFSRICFHLLREIHKTSVNVGNLHI